MKDSNQDIILLTHDEMCGYWNGTLSPKELERVEKAISTCPFCAEALEGYQHIATQKEQDQVKQFLNYQQKITYQTTSPIIEEETPLSYTKTITINKRKTILNRFCYGIAASLLFLLIPATIIFYSTSAKQDLFAANYIAYQNDIIEKIRSDKSLPQTTSTQLEEALTYYDNKLYSESVNTFQNILEDKNNSDALFFQSMAYIELSNFDAAIEKLTILKKDKKYKNHSLWYLAMIHLKLKEFETAKINLNILAQNKGKDYSGKAAKILKDLE